MTREEALYFVRYYLDDALCPHISFEIDEYTTLVGYYYAMGIVFVAVRSYLPKVRLDDDFAEEIAADYLNELNWFTNGAVKADYIL